MPKTKEQRQEWWANLSPEQKGNYLDKISARKAKDRKEITLLKMAKYGNQYACADCFHGKVKACTDVMPCGCADFWDGKDRYFPKKSKQLTKNKIKEAIEKQGRIDNQRQNQNWYKKYYK